MSRVAGILLLLGLALVGLNPTTASADALKLEIDRLGHIYAPSETVSVGVSGPVGETAWIVTDMVGATIRSGTAPLQGGSGTIVATPNRAGWFLLTVRDAAGDTARTSFAVVEPPRAEAPSDRFAVMTHFAQAWDLDVLPLVRRAGIGQVRDELYWQEVEKTKGRYALPDRYRHYLDALAQEQVKLLLVLSFANTLYDDGQTPISPDGRAAYAAYAAYLAKTLGDRLSGVEVWNEYNGSFCKGSCDKDRAGAYADLLASTYPALKQAAPGLPVGGGAAVLVPEPWFQALFDHGALANLDAVVIHPYRAEPEGAEQSLATLDKLVKRSDGGAAKPIWATEFSHYDLSADNGAETARYLVRLATILLDQGATRISWYLLRDYANFKGMGLVAGPDSPLGRYAPAPAYPAYATLIRLLDRAAPAGREATDLRTRLYRFTAGNDDIRVGWSSDGIAHLALTVPGPIERIDFMGNATRLTPKDGVVTLTLDDTPIYLRGRVTAIRETGRGTLLADSVGSFTGTAGASPAWSYGAFICPTADAGTDACLPAYKTASTTLEPLIWQADAWAWAWRAPRFHSLQVAADVAHPSALEHRQVWAVRRWTADTARTVTLTGTVARPAGKGDGSDALLLLDGTPIWRKTLGVAGSPDRQAFAVTTKVAIGSRIDFAVTPGAGIDIENDATHYTIEIAEADAFDTQPGQP
jgi:hypothetical protein